jgi:uncharacterized protein
MKAVSAAKVLVLPGIGNSGPAHWQSRWEASNPSFTRVVQRDWDKPVCSEWMASLDEAVSRAGPATVLVAHSLACLTVAHWAASSPRRIHAALLVAVPDPAAPSFPREAVGFAPVPQRRLPFRSLVVASATDPYARLEYALQCASAWGSDFVDIGPAGHINATSGLDEWREGFVLLETLIA